MNKLCSQRRRWSVIGLSAMLVAVCSAILCAPLSAAAQQPAPSQTNGAPADGKKPATAMVPNQDDKEKKEEEKKKEEEQKKKEKRGAFVVAPLPISSPAIGNGIIPVLAYIFPFSKKDKLSPPSVIGGAGLITDDGTRGFAIGAQLYFDEDRYRVTAGFAHGNVDYNVYGSGAASNLKLPLTQTGQAFFGEALRRVGWKFFLGPRFITGHSFIEVKPNNGSTVPVPPDVGLHTTLTALGVRLMRDTSNNRFYPANGTYFTFSSDFFSKDLGSKYTFQSYRGQFDKYWSLTDKQVLASDTYVCATGGQPPFYGNCIYGTNSELRGYIAGQYFTRYMLATQVEYRLELPKRFGLVVFGGLGGVIPGGQQLYAAEKFLPAGGGGLRFMLSKVYHVNLRADIAQGVTGHTFSMGVGEAF